MNRGEFWTAAGGKGYKGKPRPVMVVQGDRFAAIASVTVCPFTGDPTDAPLIALRSSRAHRTDCAPPRG